MARRAMTVELGAWSRLGLAVVVVLAQGCADDDTRTVSGVTTGVAASGVGIGLDEGDAAGEGYVVGNGVEWIGTDGRMREHGQPECLPPMSRGAEVRLHVISYEGRDRVVRVECLTMPTELYGAGEEGAPPYLNYCEGRERTGQAPEAVVEDPCVDD